MPDAPPPRGDRLAKLTAAPIRIVFQGRAYDLSPLTLRDIAQLRQFVQGYIYREAQRLTDTMKSVGAPPEHVAQTWEEAREAARNPLASSFVHELDSIIETLYLCLRARHPDASRELASQMIADSTVFPQIADAIRQLNEPEEALKNSPAARPARKRPGTASSANSPKPMAGPPPR